MQQKRYMERTNSIKGRGKRRLETEDGGEEEEDRKRPALASVIVEALKVDGLQKLFSSLEPILRRVVSEEVERALAKLGPARLDGRTSPKRIEGRDSRNLQLQFKSRLSLPLFTGGKVEGEQGATIHVVLVDADTGHVVTSGAESSVKLDIVVLEGDFNNEDDEGWSQDEFESHMVKAREGKRPLLTGDLQVTLKEGVGTVGDLIFTDNSSWIRSRKFRLGLKSASGCSNGARIREAKTEAFTVKDHRGELYKKHYPPALNDEVWRLEKIGKDGSFHKRLTSAGVYTVEDFLRLMVRDSHKLRSILGSGMSNKMWDTLVEHSKTCVLSGMLYVYYPEDSRHVGVVFNNISELSGLIANDQYYPADSLSDVEKVRVDSWVKKAYEDWSQVVEYDGKSFLNFKQTKKLTAPQTDFPFVPVDNQLGMPRPPLSTASEVLSVDPRLLTSNVDYLVNSSSHIFEHPSPAPSVDHLQTATTYEGPINLGLGPPQASLNPFEDWSGNRDKGVEDFLSEEEIRARSHEILENEDMQHLIRLFSMGGGTNPVNDSDYSSFTYVPEENSSGGYGYGKDRARPARAVVGWLKIKAAMRWGIFVRKKAAERRRARIVELEDE